MADQARRRALVAAAAAVLFLGSATGCKSKTPPQAHAPRPDAQTAREAGNLVEMYTTLVRMDLAGVSDTELAAIIARIQALPALEPPACSAQPTTEEVFWSAIFADLRGGAWESRLPTIYRTAQPLAMGNAAGLLGRQLSSSALWSMIRSAPGRSDLDDIWRAFAARFAREQLARELPDPPASAPSQPPPSLAYLSPDLVQTLVMREPESLACKWRFVEALSRTSGWDGQAGGLRQWLLDMGMQQVQPRLEQITAGELTADLLVESLCDGFAGRSGEILAAYLDAGPQQALSPAIRLWLIEAYQLRQTRTADWNWPRIGTRLRPWSAAYPDLDTLARHLREQAGQSQEHGAGAGQN